MLEDIILAKVPPKNSKDPSTTDKALDAKATRKTNLEKGIKA